MRFVVFILAVTAWGQPYDLMYAKLTGGSGDRGKCTIEYTADGTADFEILAEQGRMKTISGQRAAWKRFECNRPLPLNPADFRLSVQNGRSTLTTAPSQNRGVAVIRATGSGKFDLEWSGAATVVPPAPAPPPTPASAKVSGVSVDERTAGQGYFRDFRAAEQALTDAAVRIEGDRVQLELITSRGSRISFTGTILLIEGYRVVANMSGGTIQGSIEFLLDDRKHVQELSMTGVGPNRFELRWQAR